MKTARFVVDTHCHVTTLYRPWKDRLNELGMAWDKGQHSKGFKWTHPTAEPYDNSPLCLYDMETYGVDMCILKPSFIGTTNEMQAKLVDKYPDKFRAMCSDQNLKIKLLNGEAEWSLDVLEGLFDFYFVQPAIMAEKRKALDAKLRGAGKREMK